MTEDVGGYVLLEEVGRGAFSVVHRAEKRGHPGRVVAVKRVSTPRARDGLDVAVEEAARLAALKHPAIVPLIESVPDGDAAALVMPYLPGGSLADLLARTDGGLPWPDVATLGARLASALAAAHAAGILHRDVKPGNVLFGAEGEPHLADFSAALLVGADAEVVGTAVYLDPAVAHGQAPDVRSDVYSLGVVLYESLTGRLPYDGPSPVPASALVPDCPATLATTIEQAIAAEPAQRFAGMQQLQVELEAVAASARLEDLATPPSDSSGARRAPPTQVFGPRPPRPVADAPPSRPGGAWLGLAALVLVPLVAVAVLWPRGGPPADADGSPTVASTRTAVPCDGRAAETDGVLLADVDGRGCALALRIAEETVDGEPLVVLTVPAEGGALAGRYVVAAAGETVLAGDWDCDGTDTPAVVRPDGEVFLYDTFGDVTATPVDERVDGAPVVVTDGDCDVVVEAGDAIAGTTRT